MNNVDIVKIGERITKARICAGKSQNQLARDVKLATSTIGRYEHGQFKDIKLPIIEAIARATNVNPVWLCGYDVPMNLAETIDQKLARRIELLTDDGKEKVMEYIEILCRGGYAK